MNYGCDMNFEHATFTYVLLDDKWAEQVQIKQRVPLHCYYYGITQNWTDENKTETRMKSITNEEIIRKVDMAGEAKIWYKWVHELSSEI